MFDLVQPALEILDQHGLDWTVTVQSHTSVLVIAHDGTHQQRKRAVHWPKLLIRLDPDGNDLLIDAHVVEHTDTVDRHHGVASERIAMDDLTADVHTINIAMQWASAAAALTAQPVVPTASETHRLGVQSCQS